ncbi:unnamed protein product [Rotaria sp. Silwood2]|nr:unnamed protein product [Rotaria sp. Silwood2]CAF3062190.1 unnamed protein product [Rotaria sp. Silwood2]CAF3389495.1 unnamed protein product [Rotaria sp. Silwood2]CAF4376125.1 unnamed protein product [Rotaria sp. Silwood2]CAF4440163.1 unnamed protein product [Rotaria sp. Silwood2]
MSISDSNMKVETLAWITDDEAEFWTSTSPLEKNHASHHFSTSKDLSSNIFSFDGLYFKTNNQSNIEMQDHLSLLTKQATRTQEKEGKDRVEKKQIFNIFQLNENIHLNDNNPEKSTGFLGRLYQQLTKLSPSDTAYLDDDVFIDTDRSKTTVMVNGNTDVDTSSSVGKKATDTIPFMNTIRSFINEINEEKDVIMGIIDEETLFNRRSRK